MKYLLLTAALLTFGAAGTAHAGAVDSAKIKTKYGTNCKITDRCDGMLYVDCNSAADGPAYFLDKDLNVIGTSGGLCMGGNCTGAPDAWKICDGRRSDGPDLERMK